MLGWWVAFQAWSLTGGRIVQVVRDVRATPWGRDLAAVWRGVRHLVRQHRDGLLHTSGIVLLETALFVRW